MSEGIHIPNFKAGSSFDPENLDQSVIRLTHPIEQEKPEVFEFDDGHTVTIDPPEIDLEDMYPPLFYVPENGWKS